MKRKGSALAEAAISLSLATVALSLTWQIAKASWTNLWIDHVLYRALICAVEERGVSSCQNLARQQIKKIPLAPSIQIRLWRRFDEWSGVVKWPDEFGQQTERRMTLALEKGARRALR